MEALNAIAPAVKIVYQGKDITAELTPYLMEVTYTDRLDGQADELEVRLADGTGRWLADWYPDKGAEISLEYGYAHAPLVRAGAFDVDEIEASAPPLEIRIRALATGISRQVRTRIGKAYENTSLDAIVKQVAKRIGAKTAGRIEAIQIDRATQYQETDWVFLVRLCREYGYQVKLTDNNKTLAVVKLEDLAAQAPVRSLAPGDMTRWSCRDRITGVPLKTEVRHHDPKTGKLIVSGLKAGVVSPSGATSRDTRVKVARARTPAQAQAVARAEQARHEIDQTSMEIGLPGDPLLVAGAAVTLTGLGRLAGTYLIIEARHGISPSAGYATSLQLKRIDRGNA